MTTLLNDCGHGNTDTNFCPSCIDERREEEEARVNYIPQQDKDRAELAIRHNDRLSAAREGVVKALEGVVGAVSPDLYRKAAADHGLASAFDDAYTTACATLKELEEASK